MKIIDYAIKNKKILTIAGIATGAAVIAAGGIKLISMIKKRKCESDYDFDYCDYCDYDCENCIFSCE